MRLTNRIKVPCLVRDGNRDRPSVRVDICRKVAIPGSNTPSVGLSDSEYRTSVQRNGGLVPIAITCFIPTALDGKQETCTYHTIAAD